MRFEPSLFHGEAYPKYPAKVLEEVFQVLKKGGTTNHSLRGITLAPLLTRLQKEGIDYTLSFVAEGGYVLTGKPRRTQ